MINILQIIHKYRGDYSLLNQQVNLDRKEFRTVVCYLSGKDDGRNGLDGVGIKTIYLGFEPKGLRFHNLALLRRVKSVMETESIHVVNCQQHRSTPIGVLASRLSGNRPVVVATLHGLGTANSFRRKMLNWFLYKNIYRIIGISHGVSSDIVQSNWGLRREKVTTVQNGLVYDRFLTPLSQEEARRGLFSDSGGRADGFWFGTAGRLSPVKNHETLLMAFRKVVQEIPHAVLIIAGDGELRASLVGLANSLGIDRYVHFLGFRRDVPEIMRALDVFLLPSLREGLPLVLLEAMASGVPAVASAVGGIPEVVADGGFALLVSSGEPDQLADAMIKMARLPVEQLRRQGELARQRALHDFSAERMITEYQQIYRAAYEEWQMRSRRKDRE